MLVEMLGLPGSGKSTLARETSEVLRGRGVRCDIVDEPISAAVPRGRRVRRRTTAAGRAALLRPRWTLTTTARIASVRQPSLRDTASVLAQWLAVCDLAGRARRGPGVHLLEEGPLQTLWSLCLRSPGPPPARLLDSWPADAAPEVLVVLDVPVEVVEDRLRSRVSRHSRSQQLPPEQLRSELLRGLALVDLLVAATSTPVVRLDVGGSTPVTHLGRRLADLLAPRPAGTP